MPEAVIPDESRPAGALERGRVSSLLRGATARLVRFAMPPHCLSCGRPVGSDGTLCPDCWGRFRLIERPFCERLAIPFAFDHGDGALSPEAIADPPPFDRLRAVSLFDEIARHLVHDLKYRDHLDLARWMGRWMARAGADLLPTAELVVPVPLHRWRLWRRRFNQAAALAQTIAATAGKSYAPFALQRTRATERQVGLKAGERASNVRGAFAVPERQRSALAGRRVLLVDDVYTTGATAKAATRALLKGGAAAVDVLVFARVARGTD